MTASNETITRLGWTSDLHLNFVHLPAWDAFWEEVRHAELDALLITGDLSESEDVALQLARMVTEFSGPIYFVLGNHDFYHDRIATVRGKVTNACIGRPQLHYLTEAAPVELTDGWILCGDDGWADARAGDFEGSPIRMNDFQLISDLKPLQGKLLKRFLRREGTASAMRLSRQLHRAAEKSRRILVLTHVPPFRESCWYEGRQTDDDWAPFFVCQAVGWALRRFCRLHPQHEVVVLCGHTHHPGTALVERNLGVWTAAAEYGHPRLHRIIDLASFHRPEYDWIADERWLAH